MSARSRLRSWFGLATRRADIEQAQLDEWQFHIEQRAADLEREGVPAARPSPGAAPSSAASTRATKRAATPSAFACSTTCAPTFATPFRLLRQSPTFTAVAVLSLALGIGANSAMFSLMEAVLWKSLPVPAPHQLRQVGWVSGPKEAFNSIWGNESSTATGGFTSTSMLLPGVRGDAARRRVAGRPPVGVQADWPAYGRHRRQRGARELRPRLGRLLPVDGRQPDAGRAILPADDRRNADGTVAVISEAFWARRFGRDRSVLGQTIRINQVPVTIVGVNPPAFTGFTAGRQPDVFLPVTAQPALLPRRSRPGRRDDRRPRLLVGAHHGARAAGRRRGGSCSAR